MSTSFKAFAASAKGAKLEPFEFNPGPLRDEQVEIEVEYCGICHSDLSMLDNDWGMTAYPFVAGHEVAGRVAAVGDKVKGVKVGQRVGLGWFAESCMACPQCLSGHHNLCPTGEQTIVNRHGGFANRVRCHWAWALPLPERVGVIGIGGLGHMALQFLNRWGCEVTAFTSSDSKRDEAVKFGAHHVLNSRDAAQLQKIAGSLDFILCTANVPLPWDAIIGSLAPRGRLHIVGAVLEPIPVAAFALIGGEKSLSGSPLGSPFNTARMLEFAARHGVAPMIEVFPMSKVNEALDHLRAGKARYRIVLQNDIG
jgi:uncharacterized zinc-type alcohol dehydrogenase-like protein